jgi:hypothetical protein
VCVHDLDGEVYRDCNSDSNCTNRGRKMRSERPGEVAAESTFCALSWQHHSGQRRVSANGAPTCSLQTTLMAQAGLGRIGREGVQELAQRAVRKMISLDLGLQQKWALAEVRLAWDILVGCSEHLRHRP